MQEELFEFQRIIYPRQNSSIPENLYLVTKDKYEVEKGKLELPKKSEIEFGSFYNSLSVSTWLNLCKLKEIIFKIAGQGEIMVTFYHNEIGSFPKRLFKKNLKIEEEGNYIKIDQWNKEIKKGIIYFKIETKTNASINEMCWLTANKPCTQVKLGLVITHFNRKEAVLNSVRKFNEEFANAEGTNGQISLCVVDNSQNINKNEIKNCTLLPNLNTGGTGGFIKGLLYYKQAGYTHCLFMDDDANCDFESLRKVYKIYKYLDIKDTIAIAGIMLQQNNPFITFEVGAVITPTRYWRNKEGLSLLDQHNFIRIENLPYANYGAWCFFAFPIKAVKKYSLPLFLRGDDVLFSGLNHFQIRSFIGICCFIDSFELKSSPLTRYYSFRGECFDKLLLCKQERINLILFFSKEYIDSLLSFRYETAESIFLALKDLFTLKPDFLIKDKTNSFLRQRIKEINKIEKLSKNPITDVEMPKNLNEKIIRKFFRYLTLNGSLTPFLLKNTIIFQPLWSRATFKEVFLYRKIYYFNEVENAGYICSYNFLKFYSGVLNLFKGIALIFFRFNRLKKSLNSPSYQHLLSENFWKVYLSNEEKSHV